MSVVIPDPRWEMPELLTPDRKPVGNVVIDWDNSLTRGLKSFVVHMNNTSHVYDLVTEKIYEGTADSVDVRDAEQQLKFNGSSNYFEIPLSGIGATVSTITKFYFDSVSAAAHLRGVVISGKSTSNVRLSTGRLNGTYDTVRINNHDGTRNNIVDANTIDLTTDDSVTVANIQRDTKPILGYINGSLDDGSGRSGTANVLNGSFSGLDTLTIGAYTYSTSSHKDYWDNHISYVMVFNTVLSAELVALLYRDPYQFLIPA